MNIGKETSASGNETMRLEKKKDKIEIMKHKERETKD